jgi:2-haloacid dehalogenase
MENYLHLDPYPGIRGALAALKGRKLAILSNGSRRMLQKLVQNSGLDRRIEVVISIDSVRTYQPHRSCYALVEPVLGVRRGKCCSSRRTASIPSAPRPSASRSPRSIHRSGGSGPATMFGMLRGRAEELGHAPDHTVSALTELPKLL